MHAPVLYQPAIRVPAPGRRERPAEAAEDDGEDHEAHGLDPFDHGAGHDRGGGSGKEREGAPEDAVDLVFGVGAHVGCRLSPRKGDGVGIARAGDPVGPFGEREARGETPVDPPAEEIEGRYDEREGEDVLDPRRQRVLGARCPHFIGKEACVDDDHEGDGEVIVRLREHGVGHVPLRLHRGHLGRKFRELFFHFSFTSVLAGVRSPVRFDSGDAITQAGPTRSAKRFFGCGRAGKAAFSGRVGGGDEPLRYRVRGSLWGVRL